MYMRAEQFREEKIRGLVFQGNENYRGGNRFYNIWIKISKANQLDLSWSSGWSPGQQPGFYPGWWGSWENRAEVQNIDREASRWGKMINSFLSLWVWSASGSIRLRFPQASGWSSKVRSDWFCAVVETMTGNMITRGEHRIIKTTFQKTKQLLPPHVLPEIISILS